MRLPAIPGCAELAVICRKPHGVCLTRVRKVLARRSRIVRMAWEGIHRLPDLKASREATRWTGTIYIDFIGRWSWAWVTASDGKIRGGFLDGRVF